MYKLRSYQRTTAVKPARHKKITWQKASELAFKALSDAEKQRVVFAEEEAKRVAVWEESD